MESDYPDSETPRIRKHFVRRFDFLIKGAMRCRARAVEFGHFEMPAHASLIEHPRIILCLEGGAQFLMQRGQRSELVPLAPQEGIFIGPRRWVCAIPKKPYICMGVIYYPDYTRLYLTRAGGKKATDLHLNIVDTCIIPASLTEERKSLLRLLAGSAPKLAPDRFYQNAFECLAIVTRDLLLCDPGSERGKAHFTWQAACHYIAEHSQQPLGRKELAAQLRIHPNHVSRLFREFSGQSFSLYLQNQRLARSRLLMEDPGLNITEIARLSGFSSANYFIRSFKAHYGSTPTKAR